MARALTTQVIPQFDLRKRVPMVPIAPHWDPNQPVKTADFTVSFVDDRNIVHGRDKANKPWRASLNPAGRAIWRTDTLGIRTYYFVGDTGANGIGPPTWILALTMDGRGRPNPFYVYSYSSYDGNGIKDLVSLDGTGPQLIQQDWCETGWDQRQIGAQSGLWVTTLYEQENGYWGRADGRHGLRAFPLFEKWSRWSPEPARLIDSASAPSRCNVNHSNDPSAGLRARIKSIGQYGISVDLNPDSEFLPSVVVRDQVNGREIEMEELRPGPLLASVARSRETVVLTGLMFDPKRYGAGMVWVLRP